MEEQKTKNKVGRPSNPINFTNVKYNNKDYVVGKVVYNDSFMYFVIDEEDYPKIRDYRWCKFSNNYIGRSVFIDGVKKVIYLHNVIMNRLGFPGKGSKETVDHINRNGLDNRKENLRILTQSEQNLNQSKKSRSIQLPEDSGLTAEGIPKHIWYVKANGNHGDRFAIEFKTENITWKTTSSKMVLLKDKLQLAIDKLKEYYAEYPYLNPDNQEMNTKIQELTDSYDEIIKLVE
jgi:hypothetical protein